MTTKLRWKLSPTARAALHERDVNIARTELLYMSCITELLSGSRTQVQRHNALKPFAQLIYIVRAVVEERDARYQEILMSSWGEQMLRIPSAFRPRSFHQALGVEQPVVSSTGRDHQQQA